MLLGQGAAQLLVGQAATGDQDLPEPLCAREPLLCERRVQLVLGHQLVAKEQRSQDGPHAPSIDAWLGQGPILGSDLDERVAQRRPTAVLVPFRLRYGFLGRRRFGGRVDGCLDRVGSRDREPDRDAQRPTDVVEAPGPGRDRRRPRGPTRPETHESASRSASERRLREVERATGTIESGSSRSTNGSSCCSATSRATCALVTVPFATSASPSRWLEIRCSRSSPWRARTSSSSSEVTRPSRMSNMPSAGQGRRAASIRILLSAR